MVYTYYYSQPFCSNPMSATNDSNFSKDLPSTMRGFRLQSRVEHATAEGIAAAGAVESGLELPVPRAGQVLVRVHYSTCNLSDVSYITGTYGKELALPGGAGFEGSGVVVKVRLLSPRVALALA